MEKEDESPGLKFIEAHEMFIEHVEAGRTKIRILSVATIITAFLLLASYLSQLLLPFTSGTRYVQLDLLDPVTVVIQVLLVGFIFIWLYIAFVDYFFVTRLGSLIEEGRMMEKQLEQRVFAEGTTKENLLVGTSDANWTEKQTGPISLEGNSHPASNEAAQSERPLSPRSDNQPLGEGRADKDKRTRRGLLKNDKQDN